ncbi:N-acetylated-alpha-linked acidic dipeptidase 2-like [Saccostrea cucullata]|uniref:N-acetylated-alpha-linked acidic dipeptidase 2-like n=1 Tax=Saccostrea cuccullata TaxID=36930 RepID=UPI002ED20A6D
MEFRSTEDMFENKRASAKRSYILFLIVTMAVGIGIGILIGRFAICDEKTETNNSGQPSFSKEAGPSVSSEIINGIDAGKIRQYLQGLSELPHLAGTNADYKQAKELHDFWKSEGLDEAFIAPYDVLLSYPNTTDPDVMNRIFVYNENDAVEWQSNLYEPILHPSENKSNVVPPFNAYSAPGNVTSSELIYVNYGRVEDFQWLVTNKSVNFTGKMVIARYGKIYRGDKVRLASRYGASGIILYSDPLDYTDGPNSKVYPDGWWLPDTGTQRGTTFMGKGDPLTPGYPATDTAYRVDEEKLIGDILPNIPVHPIGYGVAEKLLSYMGGEEVPESWIGGINTTYRIGGPLKNSGWKIRIRISTRNMRKTTYNVIGLIRGEIEPDRYVLLGNHRDAWVFGAIDPSSGTAVMKEVSRVMGNLVRAKKWRPRRTIIFCSWGAEEYGLIGSTEWIEQYIKNLAERAVAYLNVDIAVTGNYTVASGATPLVHHALIEAAKSVPNPDAARAAQGLKTVYDNWKASTPSEKDNTKPKIFPLGSGSDFASFIQQIGLPSVDLSYTFDKEKYKIASYPLYHSKYETFYAVDEILDPGFQFHKAVGQVWAEFARNLADSLIIPFDVRDYARTLNDHVNQLNTSETGTILRTKMSLDKLFEAAANFSNEVSSFYSMQQKVDKAKPYAIRQINDQLLQLDRAFTDPAGLPNRPQARHILFAESSVNAYAGSSFPGLSDTTFEIIGSENESERWEIVKKHYAAIIFAIQSATSSLRDVTRFMPSM